jgi:hypothetical protein
MFPGNLTAASQTETSISTSPHTLHLIWKEGLLSRLTYLDLNRGHGYVADLYALSTDCHPKR